jgi:hypothetical protein
MKVYCTRCGLDRQRHTVNGAVRCAYCGSQAHAGVSASPPPRARPARGTGGDTSAARPPTPISTNRGSQQ